MPNRLFYTSKFLSSDIIEQKCNIKLKFTDMLQTGKIISLADSQMLKTIRQLTNHEVDLNKLEEWYEERDKIKKRKNTKENRQKIKELQDKIYNMMYIPEYITVVIEKTKHYEKFYKNGFIFNGNKYTRFSCSASQARVSTVVFIKDSIKQEMKAILDNGRRTDKPIAPSKYNAYFGLYSSAIKEVTPPRFCIIPDFCETDKVLVDYVTTTDDFSDDIVEEKEIEVEFNRFDGGGLITPEYAEIWSKDLGIYTPDAEDKGYIACQFCIRQSFAKGMLNTFPILEFCEEKNNGNYIIKDIYGKDIDLRNIDVILTEGQVKLWDSFGYYDENEEFIPSQEVYEENIKKNNIVWGVTRYTPEEDEKILITNYQFLQTLKMDNEDIEQLCKTTVDYFNGVIHNDYWYTILFLLGTAMDEHKIKTYMKNSDNYWLKALIANPNLLNDKYTKERIMDLTSKKIEQACMGKIMVQGNFQVIIPDSYALMEWVCYRDKDRVNGLLKAGECYSNFWRERNKNRILSQRSPLTHFSECHLINVKWDDEIKKWFRYSYTGFYINVHDDSVMRWAGADFDYDIIASTDNEVMIKGVYKNQKPVTYDIPKPFKKIFTEDDLFKADVQTFGSLIGPLTNRGTSIVALISEYEQKVRDYNDPEDKKKLELLHDRLKMVCAAQSRQIDKAKIGKEVKSYPKVWTTYQKIKDDDSEHDKTIKNFYNSILCDRKPYFFKHVYKDEKKRFEQYKKQVDLRSYHMWDLTLEQLFEKPNKTEEQIKFLKDYEDHNKFINSECELNRICKYIENVNFDLKKIARNDSDFNYKYFYDDTISFNEETYQKITNSLKQFLAIQEVNRRNKKMIASFDKITDSEFDIDDEFKKLRIDIIENICANERELVNYIVRFFYVDNRKYNKSNLWKLCGDMLYKISMEKTNNKIKIPVLDKDGQINFLLNKFSIKTIDLDESEGVENNV